MYLSRSCTGTMWQATRGTSRVRTRFGLTCRKRRGRVLERDDVCVPSSEYSRSGVHRTGFTSWFAANTPHSTLLAGAGETTVLPRVCRTFTQAVRVTLTALPHLTILLSRAAPGSVLRRGCT